MKANCYDCQFRRPIPGDAHSFCAHPLVAPATDNSLGRLLGLLGSAGRIPPVLLDQAPLNVRGSRHGIRRGWFNWPWNFDPMWLENCDGFEGKEVKADETTVAK